MKSLSPHERREFFKKVNAARKQDGPAASRALLCEALARGALDAEAVEKAGRQLVGDWVGLSGEAKPVRVLLLGQCTTAWLANCLTAIAWGHGVALDVRAGPWDSVIQEIVRVSEAPSSEHPDIIAMLPWSHRLLGSNPDRADLHPLTAEVTSWRQAWECASQRLGCRLLQVGYDMMAPGALGYHLGGRPHGDVGWVREINRQLQEQLPSGAYFVDLEQVAGGMGRETFYDARRFFWTKQPFSESGSVRLAEHLWAGARALLTGPKKVLVLDLDDTLWGGVAGESGPLGVALGDSPEGEAFRAFQGYVKNLSHRGVVLAVCSKNNPSDAREVFEKNPDMVLSLDDLACFEASWDPKPQAIRRIATQLRLGLESFVFFDDNPAEREHVRQALPEVSVVEVPPDPADYVAALQSGLWFEALELTDADRHRSAQYQDERQRQDLKTVVGSLDDYLRSLEMKAEIRTLDDLDMGRVVQLLGKTNQFNLTCRRHSESEVRRLLSMPGALGLTLRLKDRFGDNGLVSVLLAVPEAGPPTKALRIDTWLMSCRVLNRTAEQLFFNEMVRCARVEHYAELWGEYRPGAKNLLVADLYDRLGFNCLGAGAGGGVCYRVDLGDVSPAPTCVKLEEEPYATSTH